MLAKAASTWCNVAHEMRGQRQGQEEKKGDKPDTGGPRRPCDHRDGGQACVTARCRTTKLQGWMSVLDSGGNGSDGCSLVCLRWMGDVDGLTLSTLAKPDYCF